jgi:nucleotide-binding universal stress UspA family protein
MQTNTRPFRIVIGIDFSDTSMLALEEAVTQAALRPTTELHFATVIDSDHASLVPQAQRHASLVQIADETRDQLGKTARDAVARRAQQGGGRALSFAHVRVGPVAEQLASLATELRADLIVVGTHGRRGIRRVMMGSVAEKLVRLAPCPVLVVRPYDFHAMDTVPAIEPACAACLATRERTAGSEWWCSTHAREPDLVHIYSRSERLDRPLSPAPFGSS